MDEEVTPIQLTQAEAWEALRTDLSFLLNFFIQDPKLLSTPDFHVKVWKILINVSLIKVVLAIPRGHAKTTLSKLAVIWYFLFTDRRFCVYVSHTAPAAKNCARDIVNMLECENARALIGIIRWEKKSEVDGLYIFFIGNKRCILKAQGAGQQLRGLNIDNERPDIAVVDDLEDVDNTETPLQQRKIIRWFLGTFMKALSRQNKIIYLGNMLSPHCLIKLLCELKSWNSVRLGAILASGKSLWPELWPLKALIDDYQTYKKLGQTDIWMAEMMNTPVVSEDKRLIESHQITYAEERNPDDLMAGFITIDPATGKEKGDNTGIVVHGLVGIDEAHLRTEIVDYVGGKLDEMETVKVAILLAMKWRISIIGIETTAYQVALKTLFELYMVMQGIEGFEFVELHAVAQKVKRITSWVALLKDGAYAIPGDDMQITNELITFDIMKKDNQDDLIDSCSYGSQMLENYYHLIMERLDLPANQTPAAMLERQVCAA